MNPVPVLGTVLIASIVVLLLVRTLPVRYPRQWGPSNRRARHRLEELVSGWPPGRDAEVRWHDLPALTRQDLREATWPHGWFPAGEAPDAEGWPVRFTRDHRRAETREPPEPREWQLLAALRAADVAGRRSVVLDAVPHLVRPLPWMGQVAARAGWEAGRYLHGGCVPRMEFVRRGEPLGPSTRVGGLRVGHLRHERVEFPEPAGPGTPPPPVGGRVAPVPSRLSPDRQRRQDRATAAAVAAVLVVTAVLVLVAAGEVGTAAAVAAVSTGLATVLLRRARGRAARRGGGADR